MQQLVHRLRHRPTRERDADRLEDLPGSDTLFVCQGTQRLLERFRRPVSLAEDGDTRLERRLVTRRIVGDLLYRSEERRVGQECRRRWVTERNKKNAQI